MRGTVAVIGAGVIGASVAYHLARRGRSVMLLDRSDGPGRGSSGRATGGFRAQYGTAINVRLSLLAREKLRCFAAETGVDPEYRTTGYLWLAATPAELAVLRQGQAVQHAEGLTEATEVSPDEIARLNPALDLQGIVGGVFCPTDGFITPTRILAGYIAGAERHGARVHWGVEATGFGRRRDGTLGSVRTSAGDIEIAAAVNAAGAWAASVAAWAGVDLPVTALRRQVAVTGPFDRLPARMPMTIFAGDGFHLRVLEGRVLLLWPTPGIPGRPYDAAVDPAWIESVVAKAHRRVPVLREAVIDPAACWGGLYEMTPDKHAVLGPAPGCSNLFLANGSSGHGVMHSPALGQLLAEIICDGAATTLDVGPLRPSRFAEGALNPVSELL
ncbi:MAG TPA: FAD-dependent oxidoreductase [Gemmatimonadales bacterium]|nr:FAD-dependent oxidoreductase [Gemmatimonadales bacterium]